MLHRTSGVIPRPQADTMGFGARPPRLDGIDKLVFYSFCLLPLVSCRLPCVLVCLLGGKKTSLYLLGVRIVDAPIPVHREGQLEGRANNASRDASSERAHMVLCRHVQSQTGREFADAHARPLSILRNRVSCSSSSSALTWQSAIALAPRGCSPFSTRFICWKPDFITLHRQFGLEAARRAASHS